MFMRFIFEAIGLGMLGCGQHTLPSTAVRCSRRYMHLSPGPQYGLADGLSLGYRVSVEFLFLACLMWLLICEDIVCSNCEQ